jgi:hypothetical protein
MRTVILRLACCAPGLALLLWPNPAFGAPPEPCPPPAAVSAAPPTPA